MSLTWFSEHNLTMFQKSATAGNLCSKLLVKYTPLLWGKSPLPIMLKLRYPYLKHCFTDTRSRLLCKKKKKTEKKYDVKSLQFQFPVTWLSNSWKRGYCFCWSAHTALRLKRKEQVYAAMFVTPSKKMSWEINYTHTHTQKKRE